MGWKASTAVQWTDSFWMISVDRVIALRATPTGLLMKYNSSSRRSGRRDKPNYEAYDGSSSIDGTKK